MHVSHIAPPTHGKGEALCFAIEDVAGGARIRLAGGIVTEILDTPEPAIQPDRRCHQP